MYIYIYVYYISPTWYGMNVSENGGLTRQKKTQTAGQFNSEDYLKRSAWGAPCFQIKPKSAEAHGGSMRQQSIQMVDHSFCYQLFRLLLLPKRNVLSVNRSAASTFLLFPYPTSFTMDMITGSSVLTTGFCLSSWSNWSTVCISKASGWRYRSCFLASQFRREEEGEEGQRSQKLRETKRLINANDIYIYTRIYTYSRRFKMI